MKGGHAIETAMIGNDGAFGTAQALDDKVSDVGIVNFLCDTLMEKIDLRTPGFHRWGSYGLIEEAERRLIGFEFSCHEARAAIRKAEPGRLVGASQVCSRPRKNGFAGRPGLLGRKVPTKCMEPRGRQQPEARREMSNTLLCSSMTRRCVALCELIHAFEPFKTSVNVRSGTRLSTISPRAPS